MENEARASETRFVEYVESLAEVLGYVDRAGPLKDYCTGLLLPGERKSVEPIAAIVAPSRVSAEHQSLLRFVGQSAWSDESLLAKVRELVVPLIFASRAAILASCSAISRAWRSFARASIVARASAILRSRSSRRAVPVGDRHSTGNLGCVRRSALAIRSATSACNCASILGAIYCRCDRRSRPRHDVPGVSRDRFGFVHRRNGS